jgi:hypothetical protein
MGTCVRPSADGKPDDPQNQADDGGDPEKMEREPGTEEDQHEKKREN